MRQLKRLLLVFLVSGLAIPSMVLEAQKVQTPVPPVLCAGGDCKTPSYPVVPSLLTRLREDPRLSEMYPVDSPYLPVQLPDQMRQAPSSEIGLAKFPTPSTCVTLALSPLPSATLVFERDFRASELTSVVDVNFTGSAVLRLPGSDSGVTGNGYGIALHCEVAQDPTNASPPYSFTDAAACSGMSGTESTGSKPWYMLWPNPTGANTGTNASVAAGGGYRGYVLVNPLKQTRVRIWATLRSYSSAAPVSASMCNANLQIRF